MKTLSTQNYYYSWHVNNFSMPDPLFISEPFTDYSYGSAMQRPMQSGANACNNWQPHGKQKKKVANLLKIEKSSRIYIHNINDTFMFVKKYIFICELQWNNICNRVFESCVFVSKKSKAFSQQQFQFDFLKHKHKCLNKDIA